MQRVALFTALQQLGMSWNWLPRCTRRRPEPDHAAEHSIARNGFQAAAAAVAAKQEDEDEEEKKKKMDEEEAGGKRTTEIHEAKEAEE